MELLSVPILSGGFLVFLGTILLSPVQANDACPAALDQVVSHRVMTGETLASIAETYDLLPTTLQAMNPGLSQTVSVGQSLRIPPFNGRVVSGGAGQTWQSLADSQGVRADLLFEVNGCASVVPAQVFVPGLQFGLEAAMAPSSILSGYPLSDSFPVLLSYGWQPHPSRDEIVFNSGIAFEVETVAATLSVAEGTVAFAGTQEGYGNLVVINHRQGLQTRYGNLSEISVSIGQSVRLGDALGTVGGNPAAPFLYFEVRTNSDQGWVAQNPRQYVPALDLR